MISDYSSQRLSKVLRPVHVGRGIFGRIQSSKQKKASFSQLMDSDAVLFYRLVILPQF